MFKSLISINDLSPEEIRKLMALAAKVKARPQEVRDALEGHIFGFIFEKPSTRTWVSFQAGIYSMGGGAIYLGPEDIKLGVREEVRDVARVLSRYLSGVVMRTFSHWTITEFQDYFEKPVINGLSDLEHPCQALADYMTLYEKIPAERDPVLAFVGDGNNVLHSLMLVAAKLGAKIRYATPKKYQPKPKLLACHFHLFGLRLTVMPYRHVFHKRDPFALYRMGNNTTGSIFIYRQALESFPDLIDVVPIDFCHRPAKSRPFLRERPQTHDLIEFVHSLKFVMVNDHRQIIKLGLCRKQGRFPDTPLLNLSVT